MRTIRFVDGFNTSNLGDCNNSVFGLKWFHIPTWFSILTDVPRDAHLCQDSFALFHPSSRCALVFSRYFRSARSAFEKRVREEGERGRRPGTCNEGETKARPSARVSREIQKKTSNPFSHPLPVYIARMVTAVYRRVVLRQRSAIHSQMKIETTIINALRIDERLVIDRSPRLSRWLQFLCQVFPLFSISIIITLQEQHEKHVLTR